MNTFYGKNPFFTMPRWTCAKARIVALLGRNGAKQVTLLKNAGRTGAAFVRRDRYATVSRYSLTARAP